MRYLLLSAALLLAPLAHSASSVISLESASTKPADKALQEILAQKKPALLKFYSKDCPPCIRMRPIFENLARSLHQKVSFVAIETSLFSQIADQFTIFSTPTFVYYTTGKEIDRVVGATSARTLKTKIERHFKIKAN